MILDICFDGTQPEVGKWTSTLDPIIKCVSRHVHVYAYIKVASRPGQLECMQVCNAHDGEGLHKTKRMVRHPCPCVRGRYLCTVKDNSSTISKLLRSFEDVSKLGVRKAIVAVIKRPCR